PLLTATPPAGKIRSRFFNRRRKGSAMAHERVFPFEATAEYPLVDRRIAWGKSLPFLLLHLAPLGAFFFPVRWTDVALCAALYAARMFFITAAYHRYFAHKTYELGRVMQFLMALGGETCAQKGVLWWAGIHRLHHRHVDSAKDVHS